MTVRTLLDFIALHESEGAVKKQAVPSAYDVVWGGIQPADRPQAMLGKRLTELTVREALDWAESIDPKYQSEAMGRYQIVEDTLRGLCAKHRIPSGALFDAALQDQLATHLLVGRGLGAYLRDEISTQVFGDRIAREWASMPVLGPQQGHTRFVQRGQSYYSGDGLNTASALADMFEQAVESVRTGETVLPEPEPVQEPGKKVPDVVLAGGATTVAVVAGVAEATDFPIVAAIAIVLLVAGGLAWFLLRRRK